MPSFESFSNEKMLHHLKVQKRTLYRLYYKKLKLLTIAVSKISLRPPRLIMRSLLFLVLFFIASNAQDGVKNKVSLNHAT